VRSSSKARPLAWLAALLLMTQTPSGAASGGAFVDDDGHLHEADINTLAAAGITKGCDAQGTRFCPDDPVSRAQMASFLVRALHLPDGEDRFQDDASSPHQADINALAAAGITKGCDAQGARFCPDDPVSRAQMASFLVRALDLVMTPAPPTTSTTTTTLTSSPTTVPCPSTTSPPDTTTTTLALVPDVVVEPGQLIQGLVDTHPEGTVFLLEAGVHRQQSIYPKAGMAFLGEPGTVLNGSRLLEDWSREGDWWVATGQTQQGKVAGQCIQGYQGCRYPEDLFLDHRMLWQVTSLAELEVGSWYFDYAADQIYLAQDPTGHQVEGSVTERAFSGSVANVTIRDLVIEKYANPAQLGAIDAWTASGWVIEGNEIRLNHGVGLMFGSHFRVVGNHIHHQGQLGIGGRGEGTVVEGNEIAHNNQAGFVSGWEGGGSKFVFTQGLVVRDNHVHHNLGTGLWTDTDNLDTLYEGNLVTDNAAHGIFHEASYDALIQGNTLDRNRRGIFVLSSPNVEIADNVIAGNSEIGILGFQVAVAGGAHGPHELTNLYVHNNQVTLLVGTTGVRQSVGDQSYFTSRGNRFEDNTYVVGSAGEYFEWMDGLHTFEEWMGYGNDLGGTLTESPA
jgi:nitrous oxidase accessory protein NosD